MDSDKHMTHSQSNSCRHPSKACFAAQAARFSPQVNPSIQHLWVAHGGHVLSPIDPVFTPCFSFCSGEEDIWLSPLRKRGHVPLHATFVLYSIAQGMCLDIGPFVLDGTKIELQPSSHYEHKCPIFRVDQAILNQYREGPRENELLDCVPSNAHDTINEEDGENIEFEAILAAQEDNIGHTETIEASDEDEEMDVIEQEDESIVQSIVFDFDEESYASTSYTSSFLSSGSVTETVENKRERSPLHIPITALLKASVPCEDEPCWKIAMFEPGQMWEGRAFGVWAGQEQSALSKFIHRFIPITHPSN